MKILLAISDAIIALDIEDVLIKHFDCQVYSFNTLDAYNQIGSIKPTLSIIDYDAADSIVPPLVDKINSQGTDAILFCASKEQTSQFCKSKVHILSKPVNLEELQALVHRLGAYHKSVDADEIASGP